MGPEGELLLVRSRQASDPGLEKELRGTGLPLRSVIFAPALLDEIANEPPSLVVLDVTPDGGDLLDLCAGLASRMMQQAPAVIAVIDAQEGALIERAFAQGVRDVVPRPVSLPLLRAKVTRNARKPGPSAHQIGGYKIERVLGRGGMGVVYLAERDGQRYALKVLEVGPSGDMEALARFRREMETLRGLKGLGIPRFFEAGRTEDCFFYVMEYVEGDTLGAVLHRKPLAEPALKTVIVDIARALKVIHGANLVHRDVKPGNIIMTRANRAMLIDYGLCKFLDDFSLTRRDEVLGTMLYMSPEVLRGESIGPPADSFALGMTALHAALGVDPINGTASHIAKKIMRGEIPRAHEVLKGQHSKGMLDVIDGLLEPDPAKRLSVGDARVRLEGEDKPAQAPVESLVLTLTVLNGESEGRVLEFQSPRRIVFGRSKDVDVELFDAKVSRKHCSITLEARGAQVKDLGSANGTFVNGTVVKMGQLANGDNLRVAETQIRVELGEREMTLASQRGEAPPAIDSTTVPGYELVRRIGSGGNGAVYEGRSLANQELFAIKVSRPRVAPSPEDRARFFREAATASALVHPNIVRVYERGEHGGAFYLVMELVKGETLKAYVARTGQLPVSFALHATRQMASALELARTCGIVHRDVKPENILLQEDGTAKLTDFGLAKQVDTAGQSGLTNAFEVLGTLSYMAPEQLRSSVTADHRADIYSLGATLYHMLTGKPPFAGGLSTSELMRKLLEEEPPPIASSRSDVPPIVVTLVTRCLKKNPDERPQRAAELVRLTSQLLSKVENRETMSD